ncbi:MAG: esterase [Rhodoferax sp.]|nr:esterase [Rhodoferax sp.]MBP9928142.1 esterase [Rhodoferax sp.]HQZ04912.1 YqiA/YcfP family alpha/beta fold hydrolase [Burkholderiaceae bacterium]HRA61125.1 YqiA/YcfP family alpha/beta fold hydrolase [Burkholderiaceae bacterium]
MNSHPRTTHVLYLHGFRSSPGSAKSRMLAQRIAREHPAVTWWCPQLPMSPRQAMDMVSDGIRDWPRASMAVLGSSLGGFYATWLAEQGAARVVLLNPAIHAARDLATQVGEHAAWHDPDQRLVFEPGFVDELRALACGGPTMPQRYYLLAAKGDEVLDWREMTARYPGVQLQLLEGSDHGLSDFADHIDGVVRFLDLA